ncbi:MAG TPA: cupin domain-containing protein [Burkholderiales bacterium]|nr:cupin domain-containing protein [Burkholderiales bacterium]
MNINADFTRRAVVHASRLTWSPSPMPGVERRMLDRIGGEVARATSIVRYAARSRFSPHTHDGGEEFLVLEGVFQDEHGDYPVGTYVRNPPTSRHTPGSESGCIIFVKLWQFDPQDRTSVRIETGLKPMRLYSDAREDVRLEHWAANASIALDAPGGIELLVLEGAFEERGKRFEAQSWLRLPVGDTLHAIAGKEGACVWLKSGHLRDLRQTRTASFVFS